MAALLRQVAANRPDAVVVSSLDLYQYLLGLRNAVTGSLVLDMHNVESSLYRNIAEAAAHHDKALASQLDFYWRAVAIIEETAIRAADQVWACSARDAAELVQLHRPDCEVTVVPNAVDVTPAGPISTDPPWRLLFAGRLDWYPNVDAAERLIAEVAPLLARRAPGVPLLLAGAHPGPLSTRTMPGNVLVISNPEDMARFWPGSILAVPLRLGSGSRLKILEAFAAGCPVVTTAKGIEGIDAEPGRHYLLGEDSEELVEAVCQLLADPKMCASMVAEAHTLVAQRYSLEEVAKRARFTIMRDHRRSDESQAESDDHSGGLPRGINSHFKENE
jgi:glycosyltransferase involved in cell wall biosynthesis